MKNQTRLEKAITSARIELLCDLLSKLGLGFILASVFGKADDGIGAFLSFTIGIVMLVLSLIFTEDKDKEEK